MSESEEVFNLLRGNIEASSKTTYDKRELIEFINRLEVQYLRGKLDKVKNA